MYKMIQAKYREMSGWGTGKKFFQIGIGVDDGEKVKGKLSDGGGRYLVEIGKMLERSNYHCSTELESKWKYVENCVGKLEHWYRGVDDGEPRKVAMVGVLQAVENFLVRFEREMLRLEK
jgi:hypothetical protein